MEPLALGVGRHQAMSRPHSLCAVGGIEPFCRDEIVMNLSSLDRLWLSSPRKPRQRLDWQPGDRGSRPPWSQGILQKQTA